MSRTPHRESVSAGGDQIVDSVYAPAVGKELRRVREHVLRWSRAELTERLPERIHSQTLAGYERGTIHCTVERFVQICRAMRVSAADVLRYGLQRAQIDLEMTGVVVDLQAVIRDKRAELLELRRWARRRCDNGTGGSSIVHLGWAAVSEMAVMLGFTSAELAEHLVGFTPELIVGDAT